MEGKREDAEVRGFDSSEELSSGVADYVFQVGESAVKERGCFSLVLSGGDIPHRLEKLTRAPMVRMVEWWKWHVFWAEENVVGRKEPESIYRHVKEGFISKVPIPPAHVIPGGIGHGISGESAANNYEFSIRQQVRDRTVPVSPSSDCPRFDLVLLTLGIHGHVASLYPYNPVLEEDLQWVAWVCDDASRESVTLTLPVINAAANVAIVGSGIDVAHPFLDAMSGRKPMGSLPAQMIKPKDGKLVWFVDATAASLCLHAHRSCCHLI